jgi:flagellar biosynthetic protein FlhB
MAEQEQSRSEDATPYKLEHARKRGSVASSQDFTSFAVVAAAAVYLWSNGGSLGERLAHMMQKAIAEAPNLASESTELSVWTTTLLADGLRNVLPLIFVLLGAATLSILVQIGFLFSPEGLQPDFQRLNPMNVIKRLFSIQTLIEVIKSCLKLVLYFTCAFVVIRDASQQVMSATPDALQSIGLMQQYGIRLLFWLAASMAIVAVIDVMFVRWKFAQKMKMSRREVREESRNREGDPRIKQQRKKFQMEMLKKARALRAVRGADVLVTNPTHYAVALKYDQKTMMSPMPVAKGAGEFSLRLKRLALVYSVPVIESPALARRLFFRVPIDQQLPEELYSAAAKIYVAIRKENRQSAVV